MKVVSQKNINLNDVRTSLFYIRKIFSHKLNSLFQGFSLKWMMENWLSTYVNFQWIKLYFLINKSNIVNINNDFPKHIEPFPNRAISNNDSVYHSCTPLTTCYHRSYDLAIRALKTNLKIVKNITEPSRHAGLRQAALSRRL